MAVKWIFTISLALLMLNWINCVPVEVVYTGEQGCDCPMKLDYQVNVPQVLKPKKYTPHEYGYKVDVPMPKKAKVSYSFDFTVEEPKTPKPAKQRQVDLYAKVDRVAVNKGDCEGSRRVPSSCTCGQCGYKQPYYGYVYNEMKPCKCQNPRCNCNAKLNGNNINRIAMDINNINNKSNGTTELNNNDIANSVITKRAAKKNGIRRKRDLQQTLFRTFNMDASNRPVRYVKLYHKPLEQTPKGLLFTLFDPYRLNFETKKDKRKIKKPTLFSRIVKRDIKGEYDKIEEDRDKLDLTLPEIIQYMPETLLPNFKRTQCYFGCSNQLQRNAQQNYIYPKKMKTQENQEIQEPNMNSMENNTNEDNNATVDLTKKEQLEEVDEDEQESKNEQDDNDEHVSETASSLTPTTNTKRNAVNYNYNIRSQKPLKSETSIATIAQVQLEQQQQQQQQRQQPYSIPIKQLPLFNDKRLEENAYNAEIFQHELPQKATNPIYDRHFIPQKNSYSAILTATNSGSSGSPVYVYQQIGQKYIEKDHNGNVRVISAKSQIPDLTDGVGSKPLQYAGEFDIPQASYQHLFGSQQQDPQHAYQHIESVSSPQHYPVQHISNDQLDKIIAEIVYRHPKFIEATTHHNGALVDPEPWQEEETKSFIRKLLETHLDLWSTNQQHEHYSTSTPYYNYFY